MSSSRSPLPITSELAGNPVQDLRFALKMQDRAGKPLEVVDPKAVRALIALMDMQAVLGGAASHWGGPSAFAEINSALYALVFSKVKANGQAWYEMFHLINDAGHCENALYALKALYGFADLSIEDLKGFRSIKSPLTGHGESHLFPQGVLLSNGPLGSSLPQAQGLCMADRLQGLHRLTATAISDGACMEGEAKESLAAIPGLAAQGKMNPFVLIISDNNTKLTGRIDKDSFSMKPTFDSLSALGWEVVTLENGHDLQGCINAFDEVFQRAQSNPHKPIAIHAKTIKGYGVKKTMEADSGGHGFPVSDARDLRNFVYEIWGNQDLPSEFESWLEELEKQGLARAEAAEKKPKDVQIKEKVQAGVAKALVQKRKDGLPVVSVSADLPGSTGVAGFQKAYPEFTFDVGVAESNMVSVAAGFSKMGYIPVVDTFSQFGVTKGGLPLTMAALSEAPVIAIFSHAGFQDAADGASHQALSYFAQVGSLPHTDVFCLATSEEAEVLVGQAVEDFAQKRKKGEVPRSKIFFLGRENFPRTLFAKPHEYRLGKAHIVFEKIVP
ncbi:MAG: transketolase, partial [Bdellovibrionales bacterium]|nr:transketolase [Bdellovibrionales bacterium]